MIKTLRSLFTVVSIAAATSAIAASGRDYVSIAVDPRVIPLGTKVSIDAYPGVRFLACDVGGRIKGNHIDICVNNRQLSYKVTGNSKVRVL